MSCLFDYIVSSFGTLCFFLSLSGMAIASHRRASATFVTTVKLRCDVRCDTSLKLRMRVLLRLSKFFRCDFLCWHLRLFVRFSIISIFRAILNSHILQIVTLEQKLRESSVGEIEFLAPSCFAGSALTPDTFFGEIYRRFRELCSRF